MAFTINDILKEPFRARTKEEQVQIIRQGRPTPKKFKKECYEKERWLTACDVQNAIYCWSCLLFVTDESSEWNAFGFRDLNRLYPAADLHKTSSSHINGVLQLQMFVNENLVEATLLNDDKHKALIKTNRDIVKRIVDVVCHIAAGKPPKGKNICNQKIVQDCIDLLNLLKTYELHNVAEEAINLIKISPCFLTDTISTVSDFVAEAIKNDVQTSNHISLILTEHSDIDLRSKLSTVLRYVKDGKVCERFLGFKHLEQYKSADVIQKYIVEILVKFGIRNKLRALSCDGAVMPLRHLKTFVKYLYQKFPQTVFVPCYFHDFDFVLEQSLSVLRECHQFFKNLGRIKRFLHSTSKLSTVFNTFIGDKIPNICDFKLSNSHFLRVLKIHRREFINFFKEIVEKCAEWTEEDVTNAIGFREILEDPQTLFLLETFYMLFGHIAIFSEILSSCSPENVFEKCVIDNIEATLKCERKEGFEQVWSFTLAEMTEQHEMLEKPTPEMVHMEETKCWYLELYLKIIDSIIEEMQIRLNSLENLNFFHLLNSGNSRQFVTTDDHLQTLTAYGSHFDQTVLKNELKVINSNNTVLCKHSIYKFLETLISMNLQKTFKNVKKLAELILAMPCKTACPTTNLSKLDAINDWCAFSMNQGIADDVSFLAVEKDLLYEVKSRNEFYDEFMCKFQARNLTLQLT